MTVRVGTGSTSGRGSALTPTGSRAKSGCNSIAIELVKRSDCDVDEFWLSHSRPRGCPYGPALSSVPGLGGGCYQPVEAFFAFRVKPRDEPDGVLLRVCPPDDYPDRRNLRSNPLHNRGPQSVMPAGSDDGSLGGNQE